MTPCVNVKGFKSAMARRRLPPVGDRGVLLVFSSHLFWRLSTFAVCYTFRFTLHLVHLFRTRRNSFGHTGGSPFRVLNGSSQICTHPSTAVCVVLVAAGIETQALRMGWEQMELDKVTRLSHTRCQVILYDGAAAAVAHLLFRTSGGVVFLVLLRSITPISYYG